MKKFYDAIAGGGEDAGIKYLPHLPDGDQTLKGWSMLLREALANSNSNSDTTDPGSIVRIAPGSGTPESFFTPPASWNVNTQCWGCHSVSRDGRTMVADFYINNSSKSTSQATLATIDLTTNTASLAPKDSMGGVFGAFNDKGDKIIYGWENRNASNAGASTSGVDIVDTTGQTLVANAFPGGCAEPAWSPDGKHLSASCQLSCGTWSWDCPGAQLWTADISGNTVSNVKPAVSSGVSGRPFFSSFSPDSQWLAFAEQNGGFGIGGHVPSDLWLTSLDGTQLARLTQAMGGSSQTTTENISGSPRFAPLRAGGYSWIVFTSKRDYGNQLNGTYQSKLWIAAIDDPPAAAGATMTDPSHPAFFVRGQALDKSNMRAEFALPPCKDGGESCGFGADCCSGQCCDGVCAANAPDSVGCGSQCSALGNKCAAAADCCDSNAQCLDGYCQAPTIQ